MIKKFKFMGIVFALLAFLFLSCEISKPTSNDLNDNVSNDGNDTIDDDNNSTEENDSWELIWSDEFNGTGAPDNSKWSHEIGIHPTSGSQHYTDALENCYQQNGSLFIVALEKDVPVEGHDYTSARIKTENKFEFTYGRVEFNAKIPLSQGSWPALWMLGEDYATSGWPGCGEIDVMESVGYLAPEIHGSAHAPNYYWQVAQQQTAHIDVNDTDTQFHLYAAEWFDDHIDYYVDNILYHTVVPMGGDNLDNDAWPFDSDQFLIMNICVDGDWAQTPISESFPMIMEIDYVRVYQ
ncbi:MAG: glycoside hydrolase family 16 protein [Spirochaetaceae bacterium]|nr:glycoside hydrolase family 16 protein [Spirochaetaceae bacterium]